MDVRRKANALHSGNKLKVVAFYTNIFGIPTLSSAVTMPTIEELIEVAQTADAAGFEGLVPISRWKGYLDRRPDHRLNYVLDPFVIAGAFAQCTSYSTIFTTLNAPTAHPVLVAKQGATIDRLSGGRFAMNIVGGWNRREFDMFGIDLLDHERRYEYLGEWLRILRALWESPDELDWDGDFFHLRGALCRPQPVQKRVPIMNAGLSTTGRAFAAKNAEIAFISLLGSSPDAWKKQVDDYCKLARESGNPDMRVYTNITVTQKDTVKAAEDFYHHYCDEYRDREAVESFLTTLSAESGLKAGTPQFEVMSRIVATGGGYPVIGDAETISRFLSTLADCGIEGVLVNWANPLEGVRRMARDVFPRLEEAGLRRPFAEVRERLACA